MGKSSPQAPPPPNPNAVAAAQTNSNLTTAVGNSILGNANEIGPTGSVTYKQIGSQNVGGKTNPYAGTPMEAIWAAANPDAKGIDVPQFERTVQLSPEQQALYNQQTALGGKMNNLAITQTDKLQGILDQPISMSGLPQGGNIPTQGPQYQGLSGGPSLSGVNLQRAPTTFANVGQQQTQFANVGGPQTQFGQAGDIQRSIGPTDYSADRQRVEDAIYSRLNPQLEQDRAALENRLVNQGFQRGSQAFRDEMDAANRQANDARMQAILAGGSEQSRLANLALQSGQFANTAQQQAYGQEMGRGQFYNQGQGQAFGQAQARGQFANDAQAQQYQQAQGRGMFGLGAIDQNNQAQLAGAGFNNQVGQQGYENQVRQTQYGNDVAGRQFSDQMGIAQAMDTQRERGLQEQLALRNQPINEISALMNGGQVSMPNFTPYQGGQIANTPIGDYMYNSAALANQNYQQQMQQQNAALGGMFGLGSSAILGAMMPSAVAGQAPSLAARLFSSDRRLKRDIVDLGVRLGNGLKLYAYRYIGETRRRIGLMADEVRKVRPEAYAEVNGFGAVNYSLAVR